MTEHYLLTLHRQKENDSYKKLHTKIFIHVLVLVKLKIKKNKHKFITIMWFYSKKLDVNLSWYNESFYKPFDIHAVI